MTAPNKPLPTASFPVPEAPHHWVNSEGLGLRMQCFLVVRDADRRVACVRLKNSPDAWNLPGESFKPNESPDDCARRVSETWFGVDLKPKVLGFQNFPDHGDGKWYVLVLYEAQAPKGGFQLPEDTAEIAFAPVGKAPGNFQMDHGTVFGKLPP
jgi:ADP-ribose pyrophosphatase YjhB (NUDIX family)